MTEHADLELPISPLVSRVSDTPPYTKSKYFRPQERVSSCKGVETRFWGQNYLDFVWGGVRGL